jgi:archaellum component FlaF (FlaF/FlaG flagellin family)
MAPQASVARKLPVIPMVIAAAAAIILALGIFYLSRPTNNSQTASASQEAREYVRNLELSDVSMRATENFMKQQVVEIEGQIRNKGTRSLNSVEVYCVFNGADGHPVYREKVPVVPAKGPPLKPGEKRSFRLPFDSLPDTWNEAMPQMVIAQIAFTK